MAHWLPGGSTLRIKSRTLVQHDPGADSACSTCMSWFHASLFLHGNGQDTGSTLVGGMSVHWFPHVEDLGSIPLDPGLSLGPGHGRHGVRLHPHVFVETDKAMLSQARRLIPRMLANACMQMKCLLDPGSRKDFCLCAACPPANVTPLRA